MSPTSGSKRDELTKQSPDFFMSEAKTGQTIRRGTLDLTNVYVPPEGEFDRLIATIFAEVFSLDQVGANDDFFELGGDSLLAEVLCTAVYQRIGHHLEISALFENGSPKKLAGLLRKNLDAWLPSPA